MLPTNHMLRDSSMTLKVDFSTEEVQCNIWLVLDGINVEVVRTEIYYLTG